MRPRVLSVCACVALLAAGLVVAGSPAPAQTGSPDAPSTTDVHADAAQYCAPSTPTSPASYQAAVDNLRKANTGWASADGAVPVALPDGRTLWLYGDTFVGSVNSAGTISATTLVSNSAVVQAGACFTPLMGGSSGARTAWITAPANQGYWPSSGVVDSAGRLQIFLMHVQYNPFTVFGFKVATFSLPDLRLLAISPQLPFTSTTLTYGATALVDGGYVYVYSTNKQNQRVARVPLGSVTSASSYRFWTGSGWSSSSSAATTLPFTNVPTPVVGIDLHAPISGLWVVRHGSGFLGTAKLVNQFSDDVSLFTAPAPQGPWAYVGRAATTPSGVFSYSAQSVFGLQGMPVSPATIYSTNVQGTPTTITQYGPRFVAPANVPSPPAAPVLAVSAPNAPVHLSWTVPDNGGSPITGYKVYRATSSGGEGATPVASVAANVTSFDDAFALEGSEYFYEVAAVNAVGETRSLEQSAVSASPYVASPQGSWVGAVGARGYVLGAWNGSTGTVSSSDLVALPSGTTFTLLRGTRWCWACPTTDVRGLQSPDKTQRRATGFYDATQVQARLTFATGYSGSLHLYALDWNKKARREKVTVDDGTAASPPSVDITTDFSQGAWTSFPVNVAAGGSVTITVANTAGTTTSAVLSGIFVGDAPTVPAAPVLVVSAPSAPVHLSWSVPDTGGSPITGYRVYRSTSSGGEGATPVASVAANVTGFDDVFAVEGTEYFYEVAAVNAVGETRSLEQSAVSASPYVAAPQGTWVGGVGSTGFVLGAWNGSTGTVSSSDLAVLPFGASFTLLQGTRWCWACPTTDVRGLQSPDKTQRRATGFYDATQVRAQLAFAAGYTGTLHLYALDWNKKARREKVTVDDGTAASPHPQIVDIKTDFSQGAWMSFPVNVAAGGTVTITMANTAGTTTNAVLSGIFLGDDGAPASPPPPPGPAPTGATPAEVQSDDNPDPTVTNWHVADAPDPFVLEVDPSFCAPDGGSPTACYYAYTTNVGFNLVPLWRSSDLTHWYQAGVDDADPTNPDPNSFPDGSAVDASHFAKWSTTLFDKWAPAVLQANGQYVMWYSANKGAGPHCLGIATATSPDGPFRDVVNGPRVCRDTQGGIIDASPFTDSDGQRYLTYKTEGTATQPSRIYAAKLGADGMTLGTEALLLERQGGWELPRIEGPTLWRSSEGLFLFYSGGDWPTSGYAVGVARCATALGPCTRVYTTPVLASRGSALGPGGQSPFVDAGGVLRFAFHAWSSPNVGYPSGARSMRFLPVTFPGGYPKIG